MADDVATAGVIDPPCDILAVALEGRDDVERGAVAEVPWLDRAAVDISAGRLSRPNAIRQPGMFLSQPGIATSPSYHWACITVSMESAMMSREGSE